MYYIRITKYPNQEADGMTEHTRRGHAGLATTGIRREHAGVSIDPERLAQWRGQVRGMSREKLAARIGEIQFDRTLITAAEAGELQPSAQLARKLCGVLGCQPGDLLALPRRVAAARAARLRGPRKSVKNKRGWAAEDLKAVLAAGAEIDGHALVALREEHGWDADHLALLVSRTWFTRDAIAKLENRDPDTGQPMRSPKSETLMAICVVLECQPVDLGSNLEDLGILARRREAEFEQGLAEFAEERGGVPDELRGQYARYLAGADVSLMAS